MEAFKLQDEGNALLQKDDLQAAAYRFSLALELCEKTILDHDNIRRDLLRNRASVYLRLERYRDALADACASMMPEGEGEGEEDKGRNQKAMWRAGQAEYGLGNYEAAARRYVSALRMATEGTKGSKECRRELARALTRIKERDHGEYDLDEMYRSVTERHRVLDHASFIKNTTVASAGHRGRGLFATKDLKHGHVVMVEKAFCVDWEPDCNGFANITKMCVDKLSTSPDHMASFLDLEAGTFEGNPSCMLGDDVFLNSHQIESIIRHNSFDCEKVKSTVVSLRYSKTNDMMNVEPSSSLMPKGMWLQASYANHSCLPNTQYAFMGDMMIVRASQDILAGEEIFINYVSAAQTYPERWFKLGFNYGFRCDCALCAVEIQVPTTLFFERDSIEREADDFLRDWPVPDGPSEARAKLLLGRLVLTYDETLYGHLPRFGRLDLDSWLAQERDDVSATVAKARALGVLQDCGYRVTMSGDGLRFSRKYAVPLPYAIDAAALLAADTGNDEHAQAFLDLAQEIYVLLTGTSEGFWEY